LGGIRGYLVARLPLASRRLVEGRARAGLAAVCDDLPTRALLLVDRVAKARAHWLLGGDLAAVHCILQDPFWRRWDLDPWLNPVFFLTQLATAFTWWFEVLAPLLLLALWFRATPERPGFWRTLSNRIDYRTCFAVAGVLFHLGLHLFMRIGPFSWVILSYYPALWSGDELRRSLAGLIKPGKMERNHRNQP